MAKGGGAKDLMISNLIGFDKIWATSWDLKIRFICWKTDKKTIGSMGLMYLPT